MRERGRERRGSRVDVWTGGTSELFDLVLRGDFRHGLGWRPGRLLSSQTLIELAALMC